LESSYHNRSKATGGGEGRRFVVLHHRTSGGQHWDLMLEDEDRLLTWQLSTAPTQHAEPPIAARRIADHRLAYLDYEGPISGGRGSVRRIDSGKLTIVERSADVFLLRLEGRRLAGCYELRRCSAAGDEWTFSGAGAETEPHQAGPGVNRATR